jgi:hypothetical protein
MTTPVGPVEFSMKLITISLMSLGCLSVLTLIAPRTLAAPEKQTAAIADKVHTPAEGSAERTAILDGLRRHWQTTLNPDNGKPYGGKITFRVSYLKVHNGWAWVYAEPRSSLPKEGFPENSGFLLQLKAGRWEVMKLPTMDDNGDGAFNPSPADVARIKKMYPSMAADVIPVETRR